MGLKRPPSEAGDGDAGQVERRRGIHCDRWGFVLVRKIERKCNNGLAASWAFGHEFAGQPGGGEDRVRHRGGFGVPMTGLVIVVYLVTPFLLDSIAQTRRRSVASARASLCRWVGHGVEHITELFDWFLGKALRFIAPATVVRDGLRHIAKAERRSAGTTLHRAWLHAIARRARAGRYIPVAQPGLIGTCLTGSTHSNAAGVLARDATPYSH